MNRWEFGSRPWRTVNVALSRLRFHEVQDCNHYSAYVDWTYFEPSLGYELADLSNGLSAALASPTILSKFSSTSTHASALGLMRKILALAKLAIVMSGWFSFVAMFVAISPMVNTHATWAT